MHILVTGASGFVGRALVGHLASNPDYTIRAALRRPADALMPTEVDIVQAGELQASGNWLEALAGINMVVHCAARVHVMQETTADPLQEFRRVNVEGTLNLARQAQTSGVKRFVFISSIKVNGEQTMPGHPFRADDTPNPIDPYGVSKWEAEKGLLNLASKTGMEVVIIRPVLIYGPGVKANFQSMMRWLDRALPLPLGALTKNRRSMIALDNLTDLIATCLTHPNAANQVFLASDGEDMSTAGLLQRTAIALGRQPRLVPVPGCFLSWAARLLRRPAVAQRLTESLQVDIVKTRELLGWAPPVTVSNALTQAAMAFKATRK